MKRKKKTKKKINELPEKTTTKTSLQRQFQETAKTVGKGKVLKIDKIPSFFPQILENSNVFFPLIFFRVNVTRRQLFLLLLFFCVCFFLLSVIRGRQVIFPVCCLAVMKSVVSSVLHEGEINTPRDVPATVPSRAVPDPPPHCHAHPKALLSVSAQCPRLRSIPSSQPSALL